MALIRGRQFVIPDDVKELAVPVLEHRLILSASARMNGHSAVSMIESILSSIPVPGAETRGWLRTS
jgi:MoxR-like ATPase